MCAALPGRCQICHCQLPKKTSRNPGCASSFPRQDAQLDKLVSIASCFCLEAMLICSTCVTCPDAGRTGRDVSRSTSPLDESLAKRDPRPPAAKTECGGTSAAVISSRACALREASQVRRDRQAHRFIWGKALKCARLDGRAAQ